MALRHGLIAAFLGLQIAIPLRYYLGERGYDERFSWRMFSTVRLQDCAVTMDERVGTENTLQPIAPERELQIAWVNVLKRGRPAVVEKYLRTRCDRDGVSEVRYALACRDTDGSALPVQRVSMGCASGEVTR